MLRILPFFLHCGWVKRRTVIRRSDWHFEVHGSESLGLVGRFTIDVRALMYANTVRIISCVYMVNLAPHRLIYWPRIKFLLLQLTVAL